MPMHERSSSKLGTGSIHLFRTGTQGYWVYWRRAGYRRNGADRKDRGRRIQVDPRAPGTGDSGCECVDRGEWGGEVQSDFVLAIAGGDSRATRTGFFRTRGRTGFAFLLWGKGDANTLGLLESGGEDRAVPVLVQAQGYSDRPGCVHRRVG